MADLGNALTAFAQRIDKAEKVVSNVEALWQTAPRRSDVRRQIGDAELCALYEMAYLSIFGHWENFLEDCLTRMLAGQGCASYSPVLVDPPKSRSLRKARSRLLNKQRFLLWHDPQVSLKRVALHVTGSPLEAALDGAKTTLARYAAIRHAIAHRSDDTRNEFLSAATGLTGVAHTSPGALLRAQDHSDPLNPVRWIRNISADLRQQAAVATG